ncbi:MAG: allophanate hydrolase subunit 1 [Actinomycetota bacterium]
MIHPFGDYAYVVEVEGPESAQAIAMRVRQNPVHGATAITSGLRSVVIEIDPQLVDRGELLRRLRSVLGEPASAGSLTGRDRMVPVAFGGDDGPDLSAVAALSGLTERDVIARLTMTSFRALFLGFAPGFAYLGWLPEELTVPRLGTPRINTPRGSVAIAGGMVGIYPADLPGGWRVVGRTTLELFNPDRDPPAHILPGDRVRFVAHADTLPIRS